MSSAAVAEPIIDMSRRSAGGSSIRRDGKLDVRSFRQRGASRVLNDIREVDSHGMRRLPTPPLPSNSPSTAPRPDRGASCRPVLARSTVCGTPSTAPTACLHPSCRTCWKTGRETSGWRPPSVSAYADTMGGPSPYSPRTTVYRMCTPYSLAEDREGALWIGTYKGAFSAGAFSA